MKQTELPVFVYSRTSMKADADGIYVFTGSGACNTTMTLGSAQAIYGLENAGIRIFKNRGSATLTVTATIYDTSLVASLALTAGQGAVLVWDGTAWCVAAKAN